MQRSLFRPLYLLFFILLGITRLDAYMTHDVMPNDVVNFIYIPADDPEYSAYRAFLYRDGTLLQTFYGNEGELDDWRRLYTYHDTGAGKGVRTYRLAIEKRTLRSDPIGPWEAYDEVSKTVDTESLEGTITSDLTITGDWKVASLKIAADTNPNVTISNAGLTKDADAQVNDKGGILYHDGYSGTVIIDNATLTDVRVGPRFDADETDTSCTIKITKTMLTHVGLNGCIETFSDNRGTAYFNANKLSSLIDNEMQGSFSYSFNTFTDVNVSGNAFEDNYLIINKSDASTGSVILIKNTMNQTGHVEIYGTAGATGKITLSDNTLGHLIVTDDAGTLITGNTLLDSGTQLNRVRDAAVTDNTFTGCPTTNSNALYLSDTHDTEVSENTFRGTCENVFKGLKSSAITLSDNHFETVTEYNNIYLIESSVFTVSGNTIACDTDGVSGVAINAEGLTDSTITKNETSQHCDMAFYFRHKNETPFRGNTVSDNIFRSVHNSITGCVDGNTFVNNAFLSVSQNIDTGDSWNAGGLGCDGAAVSNTWNYPAPRSGPNIMQGPSLGGNYWSEYANTYGYVDTDKDGFSDAPLVITSTGKEVVRDNYPLVHSNLMLSTGTSNPTEGIWSAASRLMKVLHLKFANASLDKKEAIISSLTFHYDGQGSVEDIETVSLYKDAACDFSGSELLGSGTYNATLFTLGINETVAAGKDLCFILEYRIRDNPPAQAVAPMTEYCPCALYGVSVEGSDVEATLGGSDENVYGGAKGSVNAGWPEVEHISDVSSHRLAQARSKLTQPLRVKLSDIKDSCHRQWDAEFSLEAEPAGAIGQHLEADGQSGTSVHVTFDAQGYAQADFITGDKVGSYEIHVAPKPSGANPYGCPAGATVPAIAFEVFAGGIELTAQYDGSSGGTGDALVSTFITTIKAENKVTAEPILPKWAGEAKEVRFAPSWNAPVQSDTTAPFEATFDMADLADNAKMTVTAVADDGQEFNEIYDFYAIRLPSWVSTFNGAPYKGITWEFEPAGKRYKLEFNFPDDFLWSNPFPDDIPVIGEQENENTLGLNAIATYDVAMQSTFTGRGNYSGELFGKPIEVKGAMHAYFDEQFALKASPAAYADFSAKIDFDLGSKTLASKTILVYGVPITVAVDVGGNVQIFAEGKLVFTQKLAIDRAVFVPGSTITITIDASASAAFGLAKVGVRAEPQGTVKIKISYTTANAKASQEQFGGEFLVPVTIYGSLFWGTFSGDLATQEFGPWSFGDDVKIARASLARPAADTQKFYSTSAADSENGKTIQVYTLDSGGINPEVAYRAGNASGRITANSLWELDPAVTFLGGGKALALWTSNDGPKSLSTLNEVFNHQDIAYSLYDGNGWSGEALVIDDDFADGTAKVSYNSASAKALALWVHNTSQSIDGVQNRTGYQLYYALYDEPLAQWTTAAPIPATIDPKAYMMPAVAGFGNGKFLAVWVEDADGQLFTKLPQMQGGTDIDKNNTDCNIAYALYDTAATRWGSIGHITTPNANSELMPALVANGSNAMAVWVEKGHDNLQRLLMARYSGGWSAPEILDEASYVMEDPSLALEGSSVRIVYRRMNGSDEGLFEIVKPLSAGTAQSSALAAPTKLAEGTLMWNSPAVDASGNLQLLWTAPKSADTLGEGTLSAVAPASFTGSFGGAGEGNVSGRFEGWRFDTQIDVAVGGTFALGATLSTPSGTRIQSSTSGALTLGSGAQTLSVTFDGRLINDAGEDGAYRISDIVLMHYSPDALIVDRVSTVVESAPITAADFAPARLAIDAESYQTAQPMRITVDDANAAAGITVTLTSSDGGGIDVPLSPDNGLYRAEVLLENSSLTLQNGSLLQLLYIDSDGVTWRENAVWLQPPEPDFALTLDPGWNLVSPPIGDAAAIGTVFTDVDVMWGYENAAWLAYSSDAQTRTDLENDGYTLLTLVEPGKGYYVNSATAQSIDLFRSERDLALLNLQSGWNLVGVSQTAAPQEFADLNSAVDRLWCLQEGTWAGWSGDEAARQSMIDAGHDIITTIEAGEACWVHLK